MKMIQKLSLMCLFLIFFSCGKKEAKFAGQIFSNDKAHYKIKYPRVVNGDSDFFIEVTDYSSAYDSIKSKARFPVLYLFIEDTIIGDNSSIISLTTENKINFSEYSVYDEKFKIPKKLLKGKKGKYKLTIAVIDYIINDTIKANPSIPGDEDKIDMDIIDSRSYHNIEVQ